MYLNDLIYFPMSQLVHSNEEVARLQGECSKYKEDLARLRTDFEEMGEEYTTLAYKSKMVSSYGTFITCIDISNMRQFVKICRFCCSLHYRNIVVCSS